MYPYHGNTVLFELLIDAVHHFMGTATIKTGLNNGQVFTLEGYTAIEQIYWDIDSTYAAKYVSSENGLENNQCKIVGTAVGGPVTLTAKSLDGDILGTAAITFTDDDISSHTHTFAAHAAVDATCTAAGSSAYWTCSGCNKIFSDGNGTAEIFAIPTISALGHNYVNGTCTRCGDVQSQTHTHTGGTATCTARAICAVCGQEYGELLPHSENGGVMTVQLTETTAGEMTYRCTVCGTVMRTMTIPPTGEVHTHVLRQTAAVQEKKLSEFSARKSNTDGFIKSVKKFTDIKGLTLEILGEFIEKIVVHEAGKSSGKRT